MRRVLFVDPAPFPGGAQHSLALLANHLVDWQPVVAGGRPLLGMVPEGCWRWSPVPVFARDRPLDYLVDAAYAARSLVWIAAKTRPSIIHANGRSAWLPARIAASRLALPLVWHARDLAGVSSFDRLAAHLSSASVAPGTVLEHELDWPVPVRSLEMIPNGVDTDRFRPADRLAARAVLGLPADRILIGMVGQWAPWKRVDLFLEAARRAARIDPRLFFVLCGRAPQDQSPDLSTEFRSCLADHGCILDWVTDVEHIFQSLDILVHPAADEAFGRVVAEAMSCGIPVVGARAGGLVDLVADGATGLLVPPGDSGALVEAIHRLAQNPHIRSRLGEMGRSRILARFSAPSHARSVEQLYDRVLARRLHSPSSGRVNSEIG